LQPVTDLPDTVTRAKQLRAAESWSVEYMGDAFDDARMVDGRWYYRNIIVKDFQPFHFQTSDPTSQESMWRGRQGREVDLVRWFRPLVSA
jgi:hypothetical protein